MAIQTAVSGAPIRVRINDRTAGALKVQQDAEVISTFGSGAYRIRATRTTGGTTEITLLSNDVQIVQATQQQLNTISQAFETAAIRKAVKAENLREAQELKRKTGADVVQIVDENLFVPVAAKPKPFGGLGLGSVAQAVNKAAGAPFRKASGVDEAVQKAAKLPLASPVAKAVQEAVEKPLAFKADLGIKNIFSGESVKGTQAKDVNDFFLYEPPPKKMISKLVPLTEEQELNRVFTVKDFIRPSPVPELENIRAGIAFGAASFTQGVARGGKGLAELGKKAVTKPQELPADLLIGAISTPFAIAEGVGKRGLAGGLFSSAGEIAPSLVVFGKAGSVGGRLLGKLPSRPASFKDIDLGFLNEAKAREITFGTPFTKGVVLKPPKVSDITANVFDIKVGEVARVADLGGSLLESILKVDSKVLFKSKTTGQTILGEITGQSKITPITKTGVAEQGINLGDLTIKGFVSKPSPQKLAIFDTNLVAKAGKKTSGAVLRAITTEKGNFAGVFAGKLRQAKGKADTNVIGSFLGYRIGRIGQRRFAVSVGVSFAKQGSRSLADLFAGKVELKPLKIQKAAKGFISSADVKLKGRARPQDAILETQLQSVASAVKPDILSEFTPTKTTVKSPVRGVSIVSKAPEAVQAIIKTPSAKSIAFLSPRQAQANVAKQGVRQAQRTALRTGARTILGTADTQAGARIQAGKVNLRIFEESAQRSDAALRSVLVTQQAQRQAQRQSQATRQAVRQAQRSLGFTKPPPFFITQPQRLFVFGSAPSRYSFVRRPKRAKVRQFIYRPQIYSILAGVTAKKQPKLTGLEIRPVVVEPPPKFRGIVRLVRRKKKKKR